jgi:hypothetical protein
MRYKCIKEYSENGVIAMRPGDIIVISEDSTKMLNITTSMDYRINFPDSIMTCLESITDSFSEVKSTDRVSQFKSIVKEMVDTFVRKNHDYGNSFEESLNEEGIVAARVRMGDKWNRFKSLTNGNKAKVNDESVRDTLLDLANYCIMTAMWLDNGNVQNL